MEKQQKSNKNKQILDEEKRKETIFEHKYRGQGKNFLFFADQFRSWSVIYCKGDRGDITELIKRISPIVYTVTYAYLISPRL